MTKKKHARRTRLRFRKKDHEHNIHAAVQHWVTERGGDLLLTGPVSIIRIPAESQHKFYVALGCVGRAPSKPESSLATGQQNEDSDAA